MENIDTRDDEFHVDFTTASALEIFIAKIEEIFHDWELPRLSSDVLIGKGDYNKGNWLSQAEKLTLVDLESVFERDMEFQLMRISLDCLSTDAVEDVKDSGCSSSVETDLLSFDNDFCRVCLPPAGPHPLSRWYGIKDFVILVPQDAHDVNSESKIKTLLSCLQIAVDNSECSLPIFLQCGEPWQLLFQGLCRTQKLAINFEMVHLERTPSHCKHLNGMLSLFKSKIGNCKYSSPVNISVKFTFSRKDWTPGMWNAMSEAESQGGEYLSFEEIGSIPFGSRYEPISELIINAIWPKLLEQSVVDGETYSDLNAANAPIWQATVAAVDDLSCLLADHYSEFMRLVEGELKMLGGFRAPAAPLSVLRGIRAPNSNADTAISTDVLMTLLYYLFPDADENSAAPYYFKSDSDEPARKICETRLKGIKSAPYDSLPWRLSMAITHAAFSLGGLRAAHHLWNEFTQELVYRCEHNIPIPGLESGYPDPRSCLLYQKLQLLNCCISRRIERDKRDRRTADDSDSEPDEFYDADEETGEGKEAGAKRVEHAPWDQPTGRLSKHGDLLLIETGEPLYVPKTQDPVPRTEDQLEEHADLLLQLGTDQAASALRATLMSASLLADMEAFKAANPGCVLADFIRWFSPRDWVEDGSQDKYRGVKGHLSSRMTIPGNTWQEVWSVAKPVPARNQRRLFDDTKEMEKALMFLEVQTPKDFATLLLPIVTSCVLTRLVKEASDIPVTGTQEILDRIIKRAEVYSRMTTVVPKNFVELVKEIALVEKRLVHYKAICHGLLSCIDGISDVTDAEEQFRSFVSSLVLEDNVVVPNSTIRDVLCKLLSSSSADIQTVSRSGTESSWLRSNCFPAPVKKEVILKVLSSKGSQRLYVILNKHEFRLCGAFSEFDAIMS